ncbi:MAG: hypothetical protein ACI8RZ_007911 [Myxococcota bacterium]|jgi:hypothetical protein
MKRALWGMALLSGCAPPVAETAAGLTLVSIAFLIPLTGAAVFSTLTAWGLITAQQARREDWARRSAVKAGVTCLVFGGLYAATALGNTMLILNTAALTEAAPLVWLTWPGPTTPGGSAILGLAGAVMLAVGGACLLAKPPVT